MQRAFFLLSGKLLKSVHIQSPVEGAVFSITLIQAKRQLVQTSAGFDLTEQLKLTEEYLCVDRPGQNAYKQLYVAKHDKTVVYKEIGFLIMEEVVVGVCHSAEEWIWCMVGIHSSLCFLKTVFLPIKTFADDFRANP